VIIWLLRLFRRRKSTAPAVREATQVRDRQFGEWDSVMREIERVQTIARGEPRKAHRTRLH
jgi:hypothetical protein